MSDPAAPARASASAHAKVLVVGSAGFLGAAIVRALVEGGHETRGLVRRSAQDSRVASAGGVPVRGDVLDPASLRRASEGCRAIVHVAAGGGDAEATDDTLARTRIEGTRNLVAAARANGVRQLVVGSGYWVYASQPGTIDERSPVDPRGESRINFEAEREGLAANRPGSLDVTVVRPGMVYGDGAWFRPVADSLRAGTYRVIDDGRNAWSFVSLSDTGAGFRAVVERGSPGEIYNLVDGHPAAWGEFAAYAARLLGVAPPTSVTREAAEVTYGADIVHHLLANRAVSSAKMTTLGWKPRFEEYRSGLDSLIGPGSGLPA